MAEPNDRSDRIDIERRTVLRGAAGLGAAGLLGSASAGTAAAVVNRGWGWGLDHTAVGDAALDFEDDALVVSEVGDGESGVNVSLGEAGGVTVDTTLDWEAPVESFREFRTRGIVDGETDATLGLLRTERTDEYDGVALKPDFGELGADSHTFEVYDRGELVGRREGVGGAAYIPRRDFVGAAKIIIIWTDAGPVIIIVIDDGLGPIVGPRADEFVGDEIRFVPEDLDVLPDAVTDLDVVAGGRERFTLHGEAVHVLGDPYRQRGNARLHPTAHGTELGVTNLESGGGVAVGLDGTDRFRAALDGLDLSEDAAAAGFDVTGTLDGTPDSPLGSASLTNVGGELEIHAGFEEMDDDGVRVEGFRNGEKVGETTTEAGVVGHVDGVAPVGWCGSDGDPIIIIVLGGDDPDPCPTYLDGAEFEADELRFGPAEMSGAVSGLSEFGIETSNVGGFGVVDRL